MSDERFEKREEETVERLKGLVEGRAEAYEIYFSRSGGLSVEVKDGGVDALKERSTMGVGLRTISGGRLGFAFSSVLDKDALESMAESALVGSREASEDKDLVMSSPAEPSADAASKDLGLTDPDYSAVGEDAKIDLALAVEKAAMGYDKRMRRVRKATYSESLSSRRVVNSNGVDVRASATYFTSSVTAVAGSEDEQQMGWEIYTGHTRDGLDPEKVGRNAARRACDLLGAGKIETTRCPAVIEASVVCELLESLSGSFLADNVAKGKSMLAGKRDKKVVSEALNVWDDGLLPGGWATALFDAEGIPKTTTPLLTGGVLRGYLYDTYWAKRTGEASTGNAVRSGFKTLPTLGLSNLYIEPGGKDLEGLFAEMDKGLYITEVLGVHMINTVSGDFSLGASGYEVEGGRAVRPVRGLAISGNLLELFSRVTECGSDARFIGSIGAPSLLISEVEASGS